MARSKAARPRARVESILVQDLPEEVLVYDLDRHRAHCLSHAAAAVWRACDGRRTPEEIAQHLAQAAGTTVDTELVRWTVARLATRHLVTSAVSVGFDASRRDWLKKAAALAGVSVLTIGVPTSAIAATCVTYATCHRTKNKDCTGQICCDGPGRGRPCIRAGSAQFCSCNGV